MIFPVLQVPGHEHVTDKPEKTLVLDLLREDRQEYLMAQGPEAIGDVTFNEPHGSGPGAVDFPQRGMAPSFLPETVRAVRELRFVVRFKEQAHDLADQLVWPHG